LERTVELLGGGTYLDPREREGLGLAGTEEALEDTRLANHSGNFGADLGRGGMTRGLVEAEELGGRFTLGKLDEAFGRLPEFLLCSNVRVKF
tara:strand:+ start:848 stop:1123 length:276 start_codon:yes stop_codon:yes gene_type:complete